MTDLPGRLRAPRYAAPPPSVIGGEMYYDTTANELRYWNGTSWAAAATVQLAAPGTYVPSARVYKTSTFSCGPSAFYAVNPFDGERWDTDNMHSPTIDPARLTIRTAGKYLFHGQAYFPASAVGNHRLVQLRVNGALLIGCGGVVATFAGGAVRCESFATWDCQIGDFCEMLVYQDTGATQNVSSEMGLGPEFEACYLGPGVALSQPGVDPWHIIGAAGEPAFQNGFGVYGGQFAVPRFRKLNSGMVVLSGLMNGGTSGSVAFTLPIGYRPDYYRHIGAWGTEVLAAVRINTDGTVQLNGTPGYFTLDGVSFYP